VTSPEKKGMNYNEIEKLHHQVECEEEEEITIKERKREKEICALTSITEKKSTLLMKR